MVVLIEKTMAKKKRKIDINLIIAIGVLLASIGALIISTRQANIMNEQTKILLEQTKSGLWPSLSIGMSRDGGKRGLKTYFYSISNRGTGPAIVEQTYISVDDKYISNWSELYDVINVPDTIFRSHGNNILFNRVIKPNEDFKLIDWSNNPDLMNFIYNESHRIYVKICYKSVYGDYWEINRKGFKNNLEQSTTEQLKECTSLNKSLFIE